MHTTCGHRPKATWPAPALSLSFLSRSPQPCRSPVGAGQVHQRQRRPTLPARSAHSRRPVKGAPSARRSAPLTAHSSNTLAGAVQTPTRRLAPHAKRAFAFRLCQHLRAQRHFTRRSTVASAAGARAAHLAHSHPLASACAGRQAGRERRKARSALQPRAV